MDKPPAKTNHEMDSWIVKDFTIRIRADFRAAESLYNYGIARPEWTSEDIARVAKKACLLAPRLLPNAETYNIDNIALPLEAWAQTLGPLQNGGVWISAHRLYSKPKTVNPEPRSFGLSDLSRN